MPQKEPGRLRTVSRFLNHQTSKAQEFLEILELVASLCEVPAALITLLDEDKQHILFQHGFDHELIASPEAFCNHVIKQHDVFMISDASQDPRFSRHPLVAGPPHIRFYAGVPLRTQEGHNLGSFCVTSTEAKTLSEKQKQTLRVLTRQVITLLEFEDSLKKVRGRFEKAQKSESTLRPFFQSSSSCLLLMDKNLKIVAFNDALAEFYKAIYRAAPQVGSTVTAHLHLDYVDTFLESCKKALAGESVTLERLLDYGETTIFWQVTFDPVLGPSGEIVGISYTATDITKSLEHEQTIYLQNEALKQIANLQSHQLRKPVSSIQGLMELIKLDHHIEAIPELKMMDQAVRELDAMIHKIVEYAKADPTHVQQYSTMKEAQLSAAEKQRLNALSRYNPYHVQFKVGFEDLTQMAAMVTGMEAAMINFIDQYEQWSVSTFGLDCPPIDRSESICQYTILEESEFEVKSLSSDERFCNLPGVVKYQMEYYYGVPVRTIDGHAIAALCVFSRTTRTLTPMQRHMLQLLAHQIIVRMDNMRKIEQLQAQLGQLLLAKEH